MRNYAAMIDEKVKDVKWEGVGRRSDGERTSKSKRRSETYEKVTPDAPIYSKDLSSNTGAVKTEGRSTGRATSSVFLSF